MVFRYYHLGVCTILLLVSLANGKPSNPVATECNCANDAVCIKSGNKADCYCLPEWQGERCDIPREYKPTKMKINFQNSRIDARNTPCSFVPTLCKNGGLCRYESSSKKLSCTCPDAYFGPRCEDPSPCNGYCLNGGICTVGETYPNDPTCECNDELYEGLRCNIRKTTIPPPTTVGPPTTPSELCVANPTICGTGTCSEENGRLKCQCPPTYTGDFCENPVGGVVTPATQGPIQTPGPGQTLPPGQTLAPPGVGNCALNPCRNNRPCYNNGNTYYCYCGPQFAGTNCEFATG